MLLKQVRIGLGDKWRHPDGGLESAPANLLELGPASPRCPRARPAPTRAKNVRREVLSTCRCYHQVSAEAR
jgi:hypothetical protein